jgi:lysophospholipase L1-like esterase
MTIRDMSLNRVRELTARSRARTRTCLTLCALQILASSDVLGSEHWVAAWATAQEDHASLENDRRIGARPFMTELHDQTARMTMRLTLGGSRVRVHISNQFGDASLDVGTASLSVHRRAAAEPPLALTFEGRDSTTVPAGTAVTSDPLAVAVGAGQEVSVSIYFPRTTPISTSHSIGSLANTMFLAKGNAVFDTSGLRYKATDPAWVFVSAIDVTPNEPAFGVALLGDSITDGQGVDVNRYERWGDILSNRLMHAGMHASVINLGIDGNRVLNPTEPVPQNQQPYKFGSAALVRLDRDVLKQSGVRYLIVLLGINDIGIHHPTVSANDILDGYRHIVASARAAGLRVYGCTLTPALGAPWFGTLWTFDSKDEATRRSVNTALRKGGIFDAVIDFDKVVRDPESPSRYGRELSDDHIHPNRAGARLLGNAIPLALFDGL